MWLPAEMFLLFGVLDIPVTLKDKEQTIIT